MGNNYSNVGLFWHKGKKKINSSARAHIWYLCRTTLAKKPGRQIQFPCANRQQNILMNCSWNLSWLWADKQQTTQSYKCSWGQLFCCSLFITAPNACEENNSVWLWGATLNLKAELSKKKKKLFICKLSTPADVPLTPGGLWCSGINFLLRAAF